MNINNDGVEIDRAENTELYGDWIKFTDGEGASVKIAIDVVLELAEFIKEQPKTDFSIVDRNELLQELLPEIEKLFGMTYKQLEDPFLTPWFPPDIPPVRPGIYMVDQSWTDRETESVYAYWDGTEWYPQGSTVKDAAYTMCYGPKKGRPFKRWRGLKGEQ
jgi:hypothetical protein